MLRLAELYVSAAHNETYGRSLVEALRCGLPIVTVLLRGRVRVRGRGRGRGRVGSKTAPRHAAAADGLLQPARAARGERTAGLGRVAARRADPEGGARRRAPPPAQGERDARASPGRPQRADARHPPRRPPERRPAAGKPAGCAVAPCSAPIPAADAELPAPTPWACMPHPPRTSTARLALPKAAPVRAPPAGDVMAPRVEPLHAALRRRRPAGARLRTPRRPCDARRARCARLRAVLPTALRRTALRRCRAKPRHASQGAEAQPQPRSAQGGQSRLTARGPTAGSGEEP